MALSFIAGGVIGILVTSFGIYYYIRGLYEKKTLKAYKDGYEAGCTVTKGAVMEYIEYLESKTNTTREGSED